MLCYGIVVYACNKILYFQGFFFLVNKHCEQVRDRERERGIDRMNL